MILEKVELYIKPNNTNEFEVAFKKATSIISAMKGFIQLDLMKCIEKENTYTLLVKWETLNNHEIGFRQSSEYQEWKKLLHHFYEPFPEALHYKSIITI